MIRWILRGTVLVFAMQLVSFVYGQSAQSVFEHANALYKEGKYQEARDLYESILSKRIEHDAALYFNIGNCYIKENELGSALVYYKRALRVEPRDKAIQENLAFARSLVTQKIDDLRPWYQKRIELVTGFVTMNELYLSGLLLLFAAGICSMVRLSGVRFEGIGGVMRVCLTLVVVIGMVCIVKVTSGASHRDAVIVQETVDVRYGPTERDTIAFQLTEGIEAAISGHSGEWYRISLRNGTSGWIPKSSLEPI